jgi:superfamily II DNA or RNA helicase
VAIIQSLVSGSTVKDIVRNYGMLIVDECHHVSAFSFEQVLRTATAKYIYGLTATPTRPDGHHPIIFMQCGAIRYRTDAKSQAEQRDLSISLFPDLRISRDRSILRKAILVLPPHMPPCVKMMHATG